jgi:sugar phosphate isomerase/epimerase
MKFGVFNVVVPDRDAAATVALLARLGYHGIEWRLRLPRPDAAGQAPSFWGNFVDPIGPRDLARRAPQLRQLCAQAGIESFAVAGYLQMDEREELDAACAGCAALGVMAWQMGWLCLIPVAAIVPVWLWVLWDWRVTGAFRSGWALRWIKS